MFDVVKLLDSTADGIRRASFRTCDAVCSTQIDIELKDDIVLRVRYTGGCHGNTQGVASLCVGLPRAEVVTRLAGIDCKGRGTSCPDQLARALSMLDE